MMIFRLGLRLHVASFVHTPPSGGKGRVTDEIRHTPIAMNWSCLLWCWADPKIEELRFIIRSS